MEVQRTWEKSHVAQYFEEHDNLMIAQQLQDNRGAVYEFGSIMILQVGRGVRGVRIGHRFKPQLCGRFT